MQTHDLCQALLDHIAAELPEERDALLGLAALATFHPEETRLFITEAMVLLMRNECPVPDALAGEVSRRLTASTTGSGRAHEPARGPLTPSAAPPR